MGYNGFDPELVISLARMTFLSVKEKLNLLKKLDSSNDLALFSIEELCSFTGRAIRAEWNGQKNRLLAAKELDVLYAKNIGVILYEDSLYPALLREICDAPFALFYLGNAECLGSKSVSMVGTRRITPDAKSAAHDFAYNAALDGVTVVSGLAAGVDGASHAGSVSAFFDSALDARASLGKTVAVLPCGIDSVVPKTNARLARQILESGGCLVSEYVPGTDAAPWRFVQRNRIIAALSPVTVVVQAPSGSGALITADYALEYGRDVVFHKAAFSKNAVIVRQKSDLELKSLVEEGKASLHKLENSPEKFVESGAPVVSDYADFLRCMKELPGSRSVRADGNGQLLFE